MKKSESIELQTDGHDRVVFPSGPQKPFAREKCNYKREERNGSANWILDEQTALTVAHKIIEKKFGFLNEK